MSSASTTKRLFWLLITVALAGCGTASTHAPCAAALHVELSDPPLTVKFINDSKEPIRILKPLDGSEWCWIMPYYKLTVTDGHGQKIPLCARCGMYGEPYNGTKWPDDYLVTIPPGGSYARPLRLNHDVHATGAYTLCFQYVFKPESNRTPGGRYPRNLWRGEATSNTIEAHLAAVQQQ